MVPVTRSSQQDRLADIAGAATRVFGRLGYRRTQMAAVAAEAGLSTGAIYSYVASKEALFHLVFAFGFGEIGERLPDLPIAAPPFVDTLRLIRQGLRTSAATPRLRAALADDAPIDVRTELAAIIEERYAAVEQIWPLLAVIERSAVDLHELEAFYFQRGRRGYLGQLTRYLEQRARSGHLRTLPDAAVAARMMTETIVWFAWHRREDRDAALYDDERARTTIVELLCYAFTAPDR
jgi:AcrR family transcriptional regulator